jgi:hypothetical protein
MSRATLAVDMWSRIGPPRSAHALARARSELDLDPLLFPGHRELERRQIGDGLVEGLVAAQRGAADDAPGVEADQVEAGPDLVGVEEGAALEDHVDPGAARPAGVEEQRADLAAGVAGRELGQGQGDLPALGLS